jgi:formiminotetrahydrofolate cyclodeaminase
MGAALFAMVAGLPKTRTGAPEERAALDAARARLLTLADRLTELVDLDSAAYDTVVAAYRLPKATEAEQEARRAAIQAALRHAAEVPLETLRAAVEAQDAAASVGENAGDSAASDLAVGLHLLMVAASGAWVNIDANLQGLKDQAVVDALNQELRLAMASSAKAWNRLAQLPALVRMHQRAAERAGVKHGEPPPGVKPELLAGPVVAMLRRLGVPEARQALEALASSTNAEIARAAREALE